MNSKKSVQIILVRICENNLLCYNVLNGGKSNEITNKPAKTLFSSYTSMRLTSIFHLRKVSVIYRTLCLFSQYVNTALISELYFEVFIDWTRFTFLNWQYNLKAEQTVGTWWYTVNLKAQLKPPFLFSWSDSYHDVHNNYTCWAILLYTGLL